MLFFVTKEEGQYRVMASEWAFDVIGLEVLKRLEKGDTKGAKQLLDWAREEQTYTGGEDPLGGNLLTYFWKRENATASAEEMRYAAAALIAGGPYPDPAVSHLEAGRKAAADDESRMKFDLALLRAFWRLKKYQEALPFAQRLAESMPESERVFNLQVGILRRLKKWSELSKLATERLNSRPSDLDAIHALIQVAEASEDLVTARNLYLQLVEKGEAISEDYNHLAWLSLFSGSVTQQDLEYSKRACDLTRQRVYSHLHTLACLYADTGNVTESLQMIHRAMNVSGKTEMPDHDWYVFGRLAEQYGMPETAIDYYTRVRQDPDDVEAISTYRLAQKRMASLFRK